MSPRLVGTGLALLSASAFGVMPVLTKVVYDDGVGPVGVLSVRFTLAGVVLLVLARLRGEPLPRGRVLVGLLLLGGVGYALQALLYFSALTRIGAGLTALLLYVSPSLVVGLTALLARRAPRPLSLVCVAVATLGTALTVGQVQGGAVLGVVLGLGAALVYACYITASGAVASSSGHLATSAVVMLSAAVGYDVAAVAGRVALPDRVVSWAALVTVAVVCTVVAVSAFFAALARLGPADTAVVSTAEPVVSVLVAAVALGERLGPAQVVGGLLVLSAVVVLARTSPDAALQEAVPT